MANYLPCIWCGEAVDLDKDHYCRKFPKEITMLPPKYIYVITMLNVLRDELRDATPIGFSLDLKKAKKDILTNENDMWKMNTIFSTTKFQQVHHKITVQWEQELQQILLFK